MKWKELAFVCFTLLCLFFFFSTPTLNVCCVLKFPWLILKAYTKKWWNQNKYCNKNHFYFEIITNASKHCLKKKKKIKINIVIKIMFILKYPSGPTLYVYCVLKFCWLILQAYLKKKCEEKYFISKMLKFCWLILQAY